MKVLIGIFLFYVFVDIIHNFLQIPSIFDEIFSHFLTNFLLIFGKILENIILRLLKL